MRLLLEALNPGNTWERMVGGTGLEPATSTMSMALKMQWQVVKDWDGRPYNLCHNLLLFEYQLPYSEIMENYSNILNAIELAQLFLNKKQAIQEKTTLLEYDAFVRPK